MKIFVKCLAFLTIFCYNIRNDTIENSVRWASFLCAEYFFLEGVFMWNENKADRTEKYLQGV